MFLIDELAEARIAEALLKGELDDLEGMGKPLQLDDDSMVPPELRVAYRILKNSGYLPPEMETRKQIQDLSQLMDSIEDPEIREANNKKIKLLTMQLSLYRGEKVDFKSEADYALKLSRRLVNQRGSSSDP